MRSIDVVSFDVDGTLYDLTVMKRAVTRAALRRAYSPRTFRELSALGRFHTYVEALRSHGATCAPSAIHADRARLLELEQRWYVPAIRRAGVHPQVAPVLALAHARGLTCVAVSDFVAEHKLAALELRGLFSHVFAGESLGFIKPNERLFREVASRLGVSSARILHIGDRPECDGEAARSAGCRFVDVHAGTDAMLSALDAA